MVHHTPITDSGDLLHMITPSRTRKLSRSDVHFPLSTPRRHRAPSITETLLEGQGNNTLTRQKLSVRVRATACWEDEAEHETVPKVSGKDVVDDELGNDKMAFRRSHGKTLEDLPLEIQGLILDYLFGDLHSVTSTSTSLHPAVKRISSAMRHPRRKALTDVALVSPAWRELVQERIYRHIKIKGNRAGLTESADWFSENFQLTKHVRHIEFWVPVWADKSSEHQKTRLMDIPANGLPTPSLTFLHRHGLGLTNPTARDIHNQPSNPIRNVVDNHDDLYPPSTYPFSSGATSATLSEIFAHIACFFSHAQIFTLEGGHCKKSNMIRQFPAALFPPRDRRLEVLPNIRTFAMRGAWNIMREYSHWTVIESALPAIQEWHCSYAKPRLEAYTTINSILSHFPTKLRHLNISLDGFYCKDGGVEGNGMLGSSSSSPPTNTESQHHLCERLGRIAPQLETLSFTGRICECFFRTATELARARKEVSQLRAVDIVVKSCCRIVVVDKPLVAGDEHDNGGAPINTEDGDTDGTMHLASTISPSTSPDTPTTASITNQPPNPHLQHYHHHHHHPPAPTTHPTSSTPLPFLPSFDLLVLSAVRSLDLSSFPSLSHIRIRFIDLDSVCPLLNPYFVFDGNSCRGVWTQEIWEVLGRVRVGWDGELGESGRGWGKGREG